MNDFHKRAQEWNVKGLKYAELKKWEVAKRYFEKCIEIDSEKAEYWNNLGLLYCNQGKYAESIQYLEKAVAICPRDGKFWVRLGYAYRCLGNEMKGLEVINEGLKLHPENQDLWFNKGTCLFKENRFLEAKECFENVLNFKPDERYSPSYMKDCEEQIEHIGIFGMLDRDTSGYMKGAILYWNMDEIEENSEDKE